MSVTLAAASAADAMVLANLLELYIHDLSELFALEVGADGRFGYPRLARYFEEPERRFAFLVRSGQALCGFALATRGSPLGEGPEDLDVAEFFVLRRHRRSGVGRRAAFALWDQLAGHWIVRVAGDNVRALAFWRATIAEYTGAPPSERLVEHPERSWHVLDLHSSPLTGPRPRRAGES